MPDPIESKLERIYRRGEYGRLVFLCDDLLADSANAALRPILLFWKGTALVVSGYAWRGQAMTCYREGYEAAGQDKYWKARCLAGLAKIYSDSGDCDAFPKLLKTYQRLVRACPAAKQWGTYILQNHGTALVNAFRYAEAAAAFAEAAKLAKQYDPGQWEGWCYHDLSWAELQQGHLKEAAAAMEIARDLFPDETWGHKKLNVQAEYLIASGDPTGALQRVQAALAHPCMDDTTRSDVYYSWATALLALGNREEAREKALQALDFAVKAVHYPVIHKANQLVHEVGGLTPP